MDKNLPAIIRSIGCCVLFTALLALASSIRYIFPPQFERYVYGCIGMIIALITVWLFTRIDKKDWKYAGLNWQSSTLKNFFTGLLSGLILSGLMIFIVVVFNGLTLKTEANYDVPAFFAWGMSLLLLSWMEEIAFRTYAFTHLKNVTGAWTAQIIIAILFALYHVAGGQSIGSSFSGPGVWAFIFGCAVLRSGGIAMATGIHFAANILQAAIGQKKQYHGIWKIEPAQELTAAAQEQINLTGTLVQLALLLLGILLTYNVLKRNDLMKAGNH